MTAVLRSVFRVAIDSARRRGMPAVMFIGDDFQFEWGDWNACLISSASTPHPQEMGLSGTALDHGDWHLELSTDAARAV